MQTIGNAVSSFDKLIFGSGHVAPVALAVCIGIATKDAITNMLRKILGLDNKSVIGPMPWLLMWIAKHVHNNIFKSLFRTMATLVSEVILWVTTVLLAYWLTISFLKFNVSTLQQLTSSQKPNGTSQ